MDNTTTTLDVAERDRVWESTLTGARWRYTDAGGWECRVSLGDVSRWRPYKPGVIWRAAVNAHSGERFMEVSA